MDIDFILILGTIPWLLFLAFLFYVNNISIPERNKTKVIFEFVFLFMSLRYGIGYDYYSYKSIVEGVSEDYIIEGMDIIPKFIALTFGKIHYQLFFVLTSFVILYPIYWVINRLSYIPSMSFTIYLLYPSFFLEGLSIIRNAMAYSLVLVMFYFLWKKRYLRSVLFYFAAVGCHTSSLMAIIIYPLYFYQTSRKFNFLIYISSFVLSIVIIPVILSLLGDIAFFSRVLYYIENEDNFKGGGLMNILINLIGLFNLLYWYRIESYSELNKKILPLVNVGICLWNILIPVSPVFATRLSTYFLYCLLFIVPSYPVIFENINRFVNTRTINIVCGSLFVFIFVMQLYNYINSDIHMSNLPYQFFFLHTDAFVVND